MSVSENIPMPRRRRPARAKTETTYVVLTGNPNCGKTTLFNALTGLRAKVGNYPGVTVERKEGKLQGVKDTSVRVLDLPGTYSLSPQSLDEQVARDVLFHRIPEVPPPDVVVVVVDASNLQRNLYFATQVIELGYPTIIALNMIDVAEENGVSIDAKSLGAALGAEVIPIVASRGEGLKDLREAITRTVDKSEFNITPREFCELPEVFGKEAGKIVSLLEQTFPETHFQAASEALLIISDERFLTSSVGHYPQAIRDAVAQARSRLETAQIDWRSVAIESRYARISAIQQAVTTEPQVEKETLSDRLDRILTHRVWGVTIFVGLMLLLFQSIFTFAKIPMEWMTMAIDAMGNYVGSRMAPGDLNTLLVDGVIKGVGAVVVFLPQILLLFLFIAVLEDTGYMARAAFLMDRLMSKVGLHGKSFIPMLSSFACAIPGIMATRTIESPKDRLVTILVAPLMSCSARLPVYTVLIAATIPDKRVAGLLKLPGLTMLAMYMLGIVVALLMAWLFKKTLLKSATPMLIMELPHYKMPVPHVVLRHMWDRSKLFLRRAGTIILGINIILWALATYPKSEKLEKDFAFKRIAAVHSVFPGVNTLEGVDTFMEGARAAFKMGTTPPGVTKEQFDRLETQLADLDKTVSGEKLRRSFAGMLGRAIEPFIRPLGMDWKMGIGIVGSFAAREVFVSTMSTVYNVGGSEDTDEGTASLAKTMQEQTRPDGSVLYTPLMGITLMVFYVFALQCVSTVAIVRRETNSWKWPAFQWAYMTALAWVLAFITWHGGRLLGFQ
jgi:ferrous iron transport protein B